MTQLNAAIESLDDRQAVALLTAKRNSSPLNVNRFAEKLPCLEASIHQMASMVSSQEVADPSQKLRRESIVTTSTNSGSTFTQEAVYPCIEQAVICIQTCSALRSAAMYWWWVTSHLYTRADLHRCNCTDTSLLSACVAEQHCTVGNSFCPEQCCSSSSSICGWESIRCT